MNFAVRNAWQLEIGTDDDWRIRTKRSADFATPRMFERFLSWGRIFWVLFSTPVPNGTWEAIFSHDVTRSLPSGIVAVGVFVDEKVELVDSIVERYRFGSVQLHGSESPDFCRMLRARHPDLRIIKAFGVDEHFRFGELQRFSDCVDTFLFDTRTSGHGGSGTKFSWALLDRYQESIPYLLSGGLVPSDLREIAGLQKVDRRLIGADFNSGLEAAPGLKKIEKVRELIENATDLFGACLDSHLTTNLDHRRK